MEEEFSELDPDVFDDKRTALLQLSNQSELAPSAAAKLEADLDWLYRSPIDIERLVEVDGIFDIVDRLQKLVKPESQLARSMRSLLIKWTKIRFGEEFAVALVFRKVSLRGATSRLIAFENAITKANTFDMSALCLRMTHLPTVLHDAARAQGVSKELFQKAAQLMLKWKPLLPSSMYQRYSLEEEAPAKTDSSAGLAQGISAMSLSPATPSSSSSSSSASSSSFATGRLAAATLSSSSSSSASSSSSSSRMSNAKKRKYISGQSGDRMRNSMQDLYFRELRLYIKNDIELNNFAVELEQALFEKSGRETNNDYRSACRMLLLDLKANGEELCKQLMDGTRTAHDMATGNPESRARKEQRMQREREKKEKEAHMAALATPVKMDSIHTCEKCGSQNVSSHQEQTRSADEPMTVTLHCNECGVTWRPDS